MISKALRSAVANADQKEADVDRLFVSEAFVNAGPVMKRFQPKDRGRAHSIMKRTSHITVVVEQEDAP
jgi:large subunit ribosomal protein L22